MEIAASATDAPAAVQSDAQQEGIHVDLPDIQRSARNIAAWRSYLPSACVDAMIQMGWDKTT